MLNCEDLTCRRGGRTLFSGLGLCLPPKTLCVLRGANGSGKTSLLKMLAGLLPLAAGEIYWQGERTGDSPDFAQQMLYLGHQNALKPELTVLQNIAFWTDLFDTGMLLAAALHYFRLEPVADLPVGQLSAGWQRRVALARLLAVPSTLWLLDEPATNLDEEGTALLCNLITTRCNQGGIVVLASHGEVGVKPMAELYLKDFQP